MMKVDDHNPPEHDWNLLHEYMFYRRATRNAALFLLLYFTDDCAIHKMLRPTVSNVTETKVTV